jgi:4-amino-4-deoxychorismate lyase
VQGTQRAVVAVLGIGLVDPSGPVIRADDPGVTRGDGCFEGLRLDDGVIDKLDAHLARLTRSASALEIPFDRVAWGALIAEAVGAWTAPGEAAVKVLLTRGAPGAGPAGFVAIGPLPADYPRQRRDGLKVITLPRGVASDAFADAPWLLGGVKSLSYAVNMAAQREAARQGADDVVFVSADGVVLEAPTGSVVWWDGDTRHTSPTGDTGILAGTTQRLLFERAAAEGWATAETKASVADLHAADVVWLIGSVRGPVDVVELDGKARARVPEIDTAVRRIAGFSG